MWRLLVPLLALFLALRVGRSQASSATTAACGTASAAHGAKCAAAPGAEVGQELLQFKLDAQRSQHMLPLQGHPPALLTQKACDCARELQRVNLLVVQSQIPWYSPVQDDPAFDYLVPTHRPAECHRGCECKCMIPEEKCKMAICSACPECMAIPYPDTTTFSPYLPETTEAPAANATEAQPGNVTTTTTTTADATEAPPDNYTVMPNSTTTVTTTAASTTEAPPGNVTTTAAGTTEAPPDNATVAASTTEAPPGNVTTTTAGATTAPSEQTTTTTTTTASTTEAPLVNVTTTTAGATEAPPDNATVTPNTTTTTTTTAASTTEAPGNVTTTTAGTTQAPPDNATVTPNTTTTTPEQCVDVPNWRDSTGQGCDFYAALFLICQEYGDDLENDGLTANSACCSCGGGSDDTSVTIPTTSTTTTTDSCLPHVIDMHLIHSRITHNNLGGLGPDVGSAEIRYSGLGHLNSRFLDLVVRVTGESAYRPNPSSSNGFTCRGTNSSGCLSGQNFGAINLGLCIRPGQGETVDLDFSFEYTDAPGTAVVLREFYFTFADIDRGRGMKDGEKIYVGGFARDLVEPENDMIITDERDGIKSYASSMVGHACDNPDDPLNFRNVTCFEPAGIVNQRRRAVTFIFNNTSSFQARFETMCLVNPGFPNGRNFVFATKSNLADLC